MLQQVLLDHEIERFGSEARVLYRAAHHIQVESGSCVVGRKGGGIDTIHLAPRVSERAEQKPERTSDLEDARATSAALKAPREEVGLPRAALRLPGVVAVPD